MLRIPNNNADDQKPILNESFLRLKVCFDTGQDIVLVFGTGQDIAQVFGAGQDIILGVYSDASLIQSPEPKRK